MKNTIAFLIAMINFACITNACDTKVNLKLILPEILEYPSDDNTISIPVVFDIHYDSEDYDTYIKCPVVLSKEGRVRLTRFCMVYIVDDKGNDIDVCQPLLNFSHGLTLLIHAQSRAQMSSARSISAKINKSGTYYICVIFDVEDTKGNVFPVRGDAKFLVEKQSKPKKRT